MKAEQEVIPCMEAEMGCGCQVQMLHAEEGLLFLCFYTLLDPMRFSLARPFSPLSFVSTMAMH